VASATSLSERTLRGRVALLALLVIGGWLAVLTIGFNVVLDHELHAQSEGIVRARADSAAGTVRLDSSGRARVIDSSTDAALDSGIWVYSGHASVERPHGDRDLQAVADSLVDRGARFADGPDARLYARPLVQHGRQVATVVASVSTEASERARLAAIVGSLTRKARATSAVDSPHSSRSVRATCASTASAGWQQVQIRRNRSSGRSPSASPRYSAGGATSSMTNSGIARRNSASRRIRSNARLRAVVVSQAAGRVGTPLSRHDDSARAYASCTHSSARSRSRVTRTVAARTKPHSRRCASATAVDASLPAIRRP